MNTLRDIPQESWRELLGNRSLNSGTLAIDANTNDVQTSAAVNYIIDGVFYQLAIQAAIDLSGIYRITEGGTVAGAAGGYTAIPDGYTCAYILVVDTSGNIRVVEGTQVANTDITEGTKTCECPSCPPNHAVFGAVKVANASGSSFTFGTTGLDTSGVTDTYYNLSVVPATL